MSSLFAQLSMVVCLVNRRSWACTAIGLQGLRYTVGYSFGERPSSVITKSANKQRSKLPNTSMSRTKGFYVL